MRTLLPLALLIASLLLPALAAAQVTIEIPVELIVSIAQSPNDPDRCGGIVAAEFDDVPDASRYTLFYLDGGIPRTRSGPPFGDDPYYVGQHQTPSGRHWIGLTGLSSSCEAVEDYMPGLIGTRFQDWRMEVTLDNDPPTADFTWEESTTTPLTIDFDASSSSDPEDQPISYEWDFGDGARGQGEQPSHSYLGEGRYTVKLTVRDNVGQKDTHTEQVTVRFAEMRYVVLLAKVTAISGKHSPANSLVTVQVGDTAQVQVGDTVQVQVRVENTGPVPIDHIHLPEPPEILADVGALAFVENEKRVIPSLEPEQADTLVLRYEAVQAARFTAFVAEVKGRVFRPAQGDSVEVSETATACAATKAEDPSVGCASGEVAASTLVVNSSDDDPRGADTDGTPLKGCDTGQKITRDGKEETECTLRAAIEAVNAGETGPDADGLVTIRFNIPGAGVPVIAIGESLPEVEQPVSIDGTTQEGGFVHLDGSNATNAGLWIKGGASSIRGLVLTRFADAALLLDADHVTVENNVIGTDLNSATGLGNGIGVEVRSADNVIGGTGRTPGHCDGPCNVIAGNDDGLVLRGAEASRNTIVGNFIGLHTQGQALGNSGSGVFAIDAEANTFGGAEPGAGNVVAGNGGHGFRFTGHTQANALLGNIIGTNEAFGTDERLRNGGDGIAFEGARDHEEAIIGRPGAGNVISHNGLHGIRLDHGLRFLIQGNYIGTTPGLRRNLGNGGDGILMRGTILANTGELGQHQIGGLGANEPNIVAFNAEAGISLDAAGESSVRGNIVADNGGSGLILSNSGLLEVVGNTLVGNEHGMVLLRVTESEIISNLVGTDLTDGPGLGNREDGIHGLGARENLFSLNTIAGNGANGLCLLADEGGGKIAAFPSSLNRVIQNLIGAFEQEGTSRLLPNEKTGICLQNAGENLVESNTIVGNRGGGIEVSGPDAVGNRFFSNLIGTFSLDELIVPSVNIGPALRLLQGSQGTLLGGRAPGQGNVIVTSNAHAVQVEDKLLEMYQNIIRRLDDLGGKTGANASVDGVHGDGSANLRIGLPEAGNDISGFDNGIYLSNTRDAEVAGNRIHSNDTGIWLDGSTAILVVNNLIQENCTGILGENATTTIVGNRIEDSRCPASGIHFEQSGGQIAGNTITGDAGDAITLVGGSAPLITQNNLFGNAGFGLHNVDASVQVAAPGNWWGDASGPSGIGSGSGDAVSEGVDFSGWLAERTALAVVVSRDTVEVAAGETDSVFVYIQHGSRDNDMLAVTISDTQGWIDTPAAGIVALADAVGASTMIRFTPPSQASSKTSEVEVRVVSQANSSWEATAAFVIHATTATSTNVEIPDDAASDDAGAPMSFILAPNYPNPFNPQTTIPFAVPQPGPVRLTVYDLLGREVAVLVDGALPAGRHAVTFEAAWLPSGVYLYRLETEAFTQTRQMLLLK